MEIVNKLKRILKKPPRYIIDRLVLEGKIGADRFFNSRPDKKLDLKKFLKIANATALNVLWKRHADAEFATNKNSVEEIKTYFSDKCEKVSEIITLADKTLEGNLNLLGSGNINFKQKIVWNKDYKTNRLWKNKYYRDINYVDFDDQSDVKIPWEISRLQWLVPVGQAYAINQDEKYASFVKDILIDWIENNVYAHSINWTCTMEVALRIIMWEWFFFIFCDSKSWNDDKFRFKFLKSLYLHSYFTERNLEKSDVNGNHYTADGAGLVFAGLFFKGYRKAEDFFNVGWQILNSEIQLQVFPDGVDYEASIPYHRLVTELFYFPALYMQKVGIPLPDHYIKRLTKMGEFSKYYSRYNETIPLFGDADDARTLPMGLQKLNNHLYLAPLIGLTFNSKDLLCNHTSIYDELFWILGSEKIKELTDSKEEYKSKAFNNGGFYIMGDKDNHVFIDCGHIGLAGRGGHGHNDILSFDCMLKGENIISDCGAYVYTANYIERNNFRSTAYHNTPLIDGEEINRFVTPKYLWNFKNDAQHKLIKWHSADDLDIFKGSHTGYSRIEPSLNPIRTIILYKKTGELLINDEIQGVGIHSAQIPLHLDPGVTVLQHTDGLIRLGSGGKEFNLYWKGLDWQFSIEKTRISPSYGVAQNSNQLLWKTENAIKKSLTILISTQNLDKAFEQKMNSIMAHSTKHE
jgi:hypothetical protein